MTLRQSCPIACSSRAVVGAIALCLSSAVPLVAQTSDRCRQPGVELESCPPQRLRPTFSEEESRGIEARGFSESFLGDALNGIADPLGGGVAGGGELETPDRGDLTPVDRRLIPAFDPDGVFIPIPAIPESGCCDD